MEVLKKNSAILSNSEVYALLKQTKLDLTQKLIRKKNLDANNANLNQQIDKHLPTIVYESLKYLETTNCVSQSPKIVAEFLERVKKYNLTKVETLAILNHCPQSQVELQCLVEDSEERFTVEQMDELLDVILTHLPSNSASGGDDQQDDVDDDESMQTNSAEVDSK